MSILFWAGSEASYAVVEEAHKRVQAMARICADSGSSMPDLPATWRKEGSVGIVPVQGSLINGNAGYMSYFGVTGYGDISSGITSALMDPDVKSILLAVDSGGGAATSELQATADYILQARSVKPVHAFIGERGASAAYWAACPAESVMLDPMGVTGSIGCVAVQTSYARALAAAGIDKTVIRSGTYKMLGNPMEPLSEVGKAEIQSQVDDLAAMFEAYVGRMRGKPVDQVRSDMGQGRTFLGKRALAVGLVDKLGNFDQAVAAAKKR